MERNQFTFYRSFYTALKRIRKKSARADAYDAICDYALNGNPIDLDKHDSAVAIAFELITPVLKSGRKKAEGRLKGKGISSSHWEEDIVNKGEKENEREKEVEVEVEKEIEIENEGDGRGEVGFEEFWEVYPKKVGKKQAREAFCKVNAPLEELISAVNQQKRSAQWLKEDGLYIPSPANWLAREGWTDCLPTKSMYGCGGLSKIELEEIQRILNS